jgi:hypothetical protein
LNEQGVHLSLQGPLLPVGTLRLTGGHLGAARDVQAAGVRGHGACAAWTLLPGPGALGGLSASPWGGLRVQATAGSPQQVCPGLGLLADGHVSACRPWAGWLLPPQALSIHTSAGAHHALHARGCHSCRPRTLRGTWSPHLRWTLLHRCCWRLTSGTAASGSFVSQGLWSRAGAGGCHIISCPLQACVLRAQGQLREALSAWLLALGWGAGRAPQEPLTNGGPGWELPSSMTVQRAWLWATEEEAF